MINAPSGSTAVPARTARAPPTGVDGTDPTVSRHQDDLARGMAGHDLAVGGGGFVKRVGIGDQDAQSPGRRSFGEMEAGGGADYCPGVCAGPTAEELMPAWAPR